MPGNKRMDLTGQRFGKLVVLRFSSENSKPNYAKWICQCDCGVEKPIGQGHMISGRSKSCGCVGRSQGGYAHRHPMWWRWGSMIERCERKEAPNYDNYGGRGIKVCERWHSFPLFLEDMQASYFDGATLERVNNDGDYEPSNVRWATPKEQLENTRRTVFVETPWGKMTRSQAAEKAGMPLGRFINRHERGWSMDRLFDPANRSAQQASGTSAGSAKLTEDDVREIRASGASLSKLSKKYGVAISCISMARSGKTWKHIT